MGSRRHTTAPTTIAKVLKLTRLLGAGSFGSVHEAVDTRTGAKVAVKLEAFDCPTPQLAIEDCILQELARNVCPGFPRRYWFGTEDGYNILVMEKLGDSIEDRRTRKGRTCLPIGDIKDIACQALDRLQTMHNLGLVYRDIKPQNFMYGLDDRRHVLYLIDFGLCKRVVDPETHIHIPNRTGKGLTGTPRYASISTHDGFEHSMRDDIEALGYMLLFLALGELPWQRLHDTSQIGKKKKTTDLKVVCGHLPSAFVLTIEYARGMAYGTMPDYIALRRFWEAAGA
jgi:serine/threonine protein kinase